MNLINEIQIVEINTGNISIYILTFKEIIHSMEKMYTVGCKNIIFTAEKKVEGRAYKEKQDFICGNLFISPGLLI